MHHIFQHSTKLAIIYYQMITNSWNLASNDNTPSNYKSDITISTSLKFSIAHWWVNN